MIKVLALFLFIFLSVNCLAANNHNEVIMFSSSLNNISDNPGNHKIQNKQDLEHRIDNLIEKTGNPYEATLPLIASSILGDNPRYKTSKENMLDQLQKLDGSPENYPDWMRSNSFKAWMWGRVLLVAKSMDDENLLVRAKEEIAKLLKEPIAPQDNPAFFIWAWGYRAALNAKQYEKSVSNMMDGAIKLSKEARLDFENHDALSAALWAWVMNISAAAEVKDEDRFEQIKQQMMHVTNTKSPADALNNGLLRNSQSNDYPAWAMAKLSLAAAQMGDDELFKKTEPVLASSIEASKHSKLSSASAEYVLAVVESEMAKTIKHSDEKKLKPF